MCLGAQPGVGIQEVLSDTLGSMAAVEAIFQIHIKQRSWAPISQAWRGAEGGPGLPALPGGSLQLLGLGEGGPHRVLSGPAGCWGLE